MWKKKSIHPAPRVARDRHDFRLRHIERKPGKVRCGGDALPGDQMIDREAVLMITHSGSSDWKWCPVCASGFTGEPKELFARYLG